MPTRSQIPQILGPDQYVDVVQGGERVRFTHEGVLSAEELIDAEQENAYVEVSESIFSSVDHAVAVGPREEAERPIGFFGRVPFFLWPVIISLICFALYVLAWSQLWAISLWGVPLYCWWRIGGQGWSRFAAWMGWGADHELPIPWRIIGTLAGVTLSYGLGLKVLLYGGGAVLIVLLLRYTPWLIDLMLWPVKMIITAGSTGFVALHRSSPRAANLLASAFAAAGIFGTLALIFWSAFFF
jgi:hypothetical protein